MGSLEQRAAGQYRIQYEAFGNERRSSNLDTVAFAAATGNTLPLSDADAHYFSEGYNNLISDWSRKIQVLEKSWRWLDGDGRANEAWRKAA